MVEQRAAIINGEAVENVIVYDPTLPPERQYQSPPGMTLVQLPADAAVSPGDWYINGQFVPAHFASVEALPQTADPGQTVTVTATIPEGSDDTEVLFTIPDVFEQAEPVSNGQASHLLQFDQPGTYYVEVSSQRHGRQTVEVVVGEPE